MKELFLINNKIRVFVLLLTATASFALDDSPLRPIRLQLLWHHQFEFAGFYVAKQKGFYKDVGLDVEIVEAKPETNVTKEVVSGKAQFGIHNSTLLLERYMGANVTVVSTIFQHSAMALMCLDNGRIRNVHDLRGKSIMSGTDGAEIVGMLKKEGMEPSSYSITLHDYGISTLIDKKIDAMTIYTTNEPFLLEKQNISYKIFTPDSYGIDFYGNVIFTSSDTLKNDKELVDKFVSASNKGWGYALANIDKAVAITKIYSKKQNDALKYEADKTVPLVAAEYIPIGFINEGRWRHVADTYANMKMLPSDFSLDGFLYIDNEKAKMEHLMHLLWIGVLVSLGIGVIATYMTYLNSKLKTEQKKNEIIMVEQSKRVAIGAIIGNVTHQWRQPLNKISLIVANIKSIIFLNENIDKAKLVNHLEKIDDSLELMTQTISQFNHFYSGRTKKEEFLVYKVIDNISTLVSDRLIQNNIKIFNELDKTLLISGYKNNFANLFLSLIENAVENFEIKNTKMPNIVFSSHNIDDFIVISVSDNGGGIDDEHMATIFEPFTSTKKTGSGMGLAIVKTIVEKRLGGTIKAINTKDGACFEIFLPKKDKG